MIFEYEDTAGIPRKIDIPDKATNIRVSYGNYEELKWIYVWYTNHGHEDCKRLARTGRENLRYYQDQFRELSKQTKVRSHGRVIV